MLVYYECYIWIGLTFPKVLTLIKQAHQNSVIFVIIGDS